MAKDVVGKITGVFPTESDGFVVDSTLTDFVVDEKPIKNVLGKFTGIVSTVCRPAAGELETEGRVFEMVSRG